MKHLRIWLLLLLAVLLPVRGAVAAAMLCPPAGVGTQNQVRVLDHHLGSHHTMVRAAAESVGHDHAMHDHGSASTDDGKSLSVQDKCNLCSAFCSMTPLVSSPLTMPTPQEPGATAFPDLFAPPPNFLSDGQERPPRST